MTCAWAQISLQPGASVKRAAAAVHKLASGNELKGHLTWAARTQYEHEVASLQRFLVDASVSGGDRALHCSFRPSGCRLACCSHLVRRLPQLRCHAGAWVHLPYERTGLEGCRDAEAAERCSSCAVEVVAPWRSLACLTPDATQLAAGPSWGPKPFQ